MSPLFHNSTPQTLSLDEWLIQDRDASFMLTIQSDAWREDGIFSGDTLIIERGREPRTNDFILISAENGFSLERFPLSPTKYFSALQIDGVVIVIIRKLT